MSAGYVHLSLDAAEPLRPPHDDVPQRWLPLRSLLGVSAFGINAWEGAQAGDVVVEPHDEATDDGTPGHEEIYLVLRGAADFTVGDDTFPAAAGRLVFISDPALHREARATEPNTLVLAVGGPKGSFPRSEWEGRWLAASGATPGRGSAPRP